ncbi:MAG: DUF4402 domain-containing protein [Bacteroidales bacterium]|jgi:hypothetical protein|nr:DUF4402 domain-containing protein [Bacteroidales bacterium]MDD2263564.1 DUF4402 domain-containing protein [Bacteroidales bacterium]MDD2830645.1 DUF4402 domain-containing protein [Bacteroidales bacterium]MDD3207844.1 DUF4402 domain-containing protein [Bacteroidales bacterium]MDD3696648.1 DUF4402 domain-containing protein [Bacteroidales bacterium]
MKGKRWTHELILTWFLLLSMQPLQPLQGMDPDPEITGRVIAELIEALSVEEASPLNFGRFFIDGQGGGTITITASPVVDRLAAGNAVHLASGGNPGPAVYQVMGHPQASVNITPPEPALLMHATNPAYRMVVAEWTYFPPGAAKLDANGKLTFYIGATLHVESLAMNPVGIYSGTYNVTFAYD